MSLGTLGPSTQGSRGEREAAPLPHWKQLAIGPEEQLARLDPAFVQFVANMGLPGSERLKPWCCLDTLASWTERVRSYTAQHLPRFRRDPGNFDNSEAYFRALCLATVLQKEFGVRYDTQKVPTGVPFEVEDTTVQGAILGDGGTCASLPVLYASIGRRLGYPIKLVHAFVGGGVGHFFARWEGDEARFNIEATGTGLATPPDDHYRQGRYQLTPELERLGGFLRSLSPRQELSGYLRERGWHWRRFGNRGRSAEAYAWAFALDPQNVVAEDTLKGSLNEWTRWTRQLMPPGFPEVMIERPGGVRFFHETLPIEYERQLLGLSAVENLLLDPEYGKAWERMRRGEWRRSGPNHATVVYRPDGTSEATVQFNA